MKQIVILDTEDRVCFVAPAKVSKDLYPGQTVKFTGTELQAKKEIQRLAELAAKTYASITWTGDVWFSYGERR